MESSNQIEWRVIGETVPGASHIRAGIPNQDSILCVRESSRSLPIIVSVADGHGSAKCFRSDFGSQFAVKKAAQIVGEFLDERRGKFDLAEIESVGKDYLPKEFVKKWRKTAEYHLKNNPFTEDEFKKLEEKSGANSRKLIEENPLLAYGTTSLTVAMEDDFILYMQLGDGDILNVLGAGEVTKPLPEDARLLANETTSLCLPKAEEDFRFLVQKISAEASPQMILLSTDGYLNSFSDEAGFFQAATDILQMLRTENGFNDVNDNLKAWLEEATQMGSGDDCAVAIIYRPDAVKKFEKFEQSEKLKTTTTETPPSKETSQAIAALTDSETVAPEDLEDVTVTITIKKDKNKISKSSSVALAETDSASSKLKNSPENKTEEKEETPAS
ncbi:MAG: protein phosphatase 2C domain-containing protein [Pyrinomonadaceae bacterium]|nr:protein phosphatase 2C domain-containing protein [Pyrinomonadaceae bacterium]